VQDDAGKGDAERALIVEIRGDLAGRFGHRLRCRGLRGVQPEPVTDQDAAAKVDHTALDPGAADVDAESRLWLLHDCHAELLAVW
jgi:hypothetical protein